MSYNPDNVLKVINDLEAKYGKCGGLSSYMTSIEKKYSIKNTQNTANIMPSIQTESVVKDKVEEKSVFTIEPRSKSISRQMPLRSMPQLKPIPKDMILDIQDQNSWQDYINKVKDISKIEAFFGQVFVKSIYGNNLRKLKEKYKSNYDIKINQYLNQVNKIRIPEDFDEDTNVEIAGKIGKLVKSYFVQALLKSAHNGIISNESMYGEKDFCQAYEDVLDRYLKGIKCCKLSATTSMPNIRFRTNIKFDNNLNEYFEAHNQNKGSSIKEIISYPRIIYYIDDDKKVSHNIIEGEVILF